MRPQIRPSCGKPRRCSCNLVRMAVVDYPMAPTPSTNDVCGKPCRRRTSSPKKTAPEPLKRSGRTLCKVAQKKQHAYHLVTHQLQHRACEKVGFGIAEHVLEVLAETVLAHGEALISHGEAAVNASGKLGLRFAQVFSKPLGAAKAAGSWIRRRLNRNSPEVQAAAHHAGGHLASQTGAHWAHGLLHGLHIALPLVGTYLLAHMTHHDFHRAKSEWHDRRTLVPTALFALATVCDALDALAHLVIVLGLTVVHIDHHTEHRLHEISMFAALIACDACMSGEAICAAAGHGDHGHGHGHGAGAEGKGASDAKRVVGLFAKREGGSAFAKALKAD